MEEYIKEYLNIPFAVVNLFLIWFAILITEHTLKVKLTTFQKKLATVATSIILIVAFYIAFHDNVKTMLISACVTVVSYDYLVGNIFKMLKKKINSLLSSTDNVNEENTNTD
jgi:uncharacterized membrane protein YjjP (DUF1212 family)